MPKIKSGQAPALELYHFRRADDLGTVMVAINRFAFSTKKYEGFNLFKAEVLRLIGLFAEKFRIEKLNRTGLRYTNVIPFVREQEKVPLSNYLNVEIKLPSAFPEEFQHLDLAFVSQKQGGSITTRIEPLLAQSGGGEAILLDFDFAKEKELDIRHIETYIDESHRHTKGMFEKIITESYLKYIKGETV